MITNKHNLPAPIFNAVNKTYQPKPDRFSVTDLIGSALIRKLKLEHWEELTEDASDRLWALLGQAVDSVISKNAVDTIVQHKFEIPIDGVVVVGKPDIYYPYTEAIEDWKVTSVWSFVLGGKKDWEEQLNCYAWGFRREDVRVKSLRINAILRDWQKSKMMRDEDYPRIPFVSRDIPLWTFEEQEQYIKDQLEYHRMSEPKECSPEDKWEKPTTYAVMKKGRKSALRVLGSHPQAEDWCEHNNCAKWIMETDDEGQTGRGTFTLNSGITIECRKGECTRCLNYCPVRTVCEFSGLKK